MKNVIRYVFKLCEKLILVSTVTGCVSISTFSSLFCVSVDITSSAVRICAIILGIKIYKRIIKKEQKSW